MEDLLPDYETKFTKWNNSNGFLNKEEFSPTLDAFTHWTYATTKGNLMVVDLQGVEQEKEYTLTDPSIHCKKPKYGSTNCGEVGMQQFLQTHKCDNVCCTLELDKIHIKKIPLFGNYRRKEKNDEDT